MNTITTIKNKIEGAFYKGLSRITIRMAAKCYRNGNDEKFYKWSEIDKKVCSKCNELSIN